MTENKAPTVPIFDEMSTHSLRISRHSRHRKTRKYEMIEDLARLSYLDEVCLKFCSSPTDSAQFDEIFLHLKIFTINLNNAACNIVGHHSTLLASAVCYRTNLHEYR